MDFKDEFDFISEKAKQLTDTGIRKADEVIGISNSSSDVFSLTH